MRPLPVESRVAEERDRPDTSGAVRGRGASATRVVREPGRWSRLVTGLAALALVSGVVALVLDGTGGPARPDDGTVDPGVAYREAVHRLGRTRTFAYRGAVHASGPSSLRPGPSPLGDVTVEGAVRLPQSITRDVAVDERGAAVETVTSGSTVWSRSAAGVQQLEDAAWERIGPPEPFGGGYARSRLGAALLADLLRAASDRRRDGTDAAGRTVLRATVPPDDRHQRYGDALDGADVRVTLDEDGDIARIVLSSAESVPRLVLRLDVVGLGDAGVITPADVGTPARGAVSADDLGAAGVEALEVGGLPTGWALTDAQLVTERWPATETATQPTMPGRAWRCPSLSVDYRDLRAVSEGSLHLTSWAPACMTATARVGTGGRPLRLGRFEGRVFESFDTTVGDLYDGMTQISFSTDLTLDEAAGLLASLRPFDPAAPPAA